MSIRLALVCAVSVAAFASSAAAFSNRVDTEKFVSAAGVDFNDAQETAVFYANLQRAARHACDSGMGRNLGAVAADRACAEDALERAVRQTGQPALAALHQTQTGRSAPATVLAAK